MTTTTISYQEYLLIEGIIKSNDPLDSYREGYLSFLDKLEKNYESSLQEEAKIDQNVDLDTISIKIEIPENVGLFIADELKDNAVFTLNSKLKSIKY